MNTQLVAAEVRLQQWAEVVRLRSVYIPPTETHCHGKIEPPSRDLRATITEK